MAVDFFKNIGEIRSYVASVDASTMIDNLEPHFRPAREKLINLIGATTYSQLKTYYNDSYPGGDEKKDAAIKYIQGALANLIARPLMIFNAKGPDDESRLYRYQEEKQLELYLDNAWTELNNLITHLENNTETFSAFVDTDRYKERQDLFIKSAHQFQKYYPINDSAYFYNNVVYILKEVQMDVMSREDDFPESISSMSDRYQYYIGKALCFETMSRACKRMDYTELPRGIRNDVMKEVNQRARLTTYQEDYLRETLPVYLHQEAEKWFSKIDFEANKTRNDGVYIPPSSDDPIDENDKFVAPGL